MSDAIFCDYDARAAEERIIKKYEELTGTVLSDADPAAVFLKTLAYVVSQQLFAIEETGRQNLLRYAQGDKLDALAEFAGTSRIPAKAASCEVVFTRTKGTTAEVFIRAGTRITGAAGLFFFCPEDARIPAGEESVRVACMCSESGEKGNSCPAGSLDKIVDAAAYLAGAANVTESSGGADEESDESLRERIRLAPESYSSAGPALAYKFHAMSAHQSVKDAAVVSGAPGRVTVYPLLSAGANAAAVNALVLEKLSGDRTRPLTDFVEVSEPEIVNYEIEGRYYAYDDVPVSREAVDEAVARYILWQEEKLGREINPDRLARDLLDLGLKRVIITKPVYRELEPFQAARLSGASSGPFLTDGAERNV